MQMEHLHHIRNRWVIAVVQAQTMLRQPPMQANFQLFGGGNENQYVPNYPNQELRLYFYKAPQVFV